jgi:hypothetical protein
MENRKSALRHLCGGILLSCSLLSPVSALLYGQEKAGQAAQSDQATPPPAPKELIVALKEVPVWELANERVRESFLRGQYAPIRVLEKGMVLPVKWPQFTSDAPLYGQVSFQNLASGSRKSDQFYFALDSLQKGGDYDLLYFDDNGDGDLTNDKPRKPSKEVNGVVRHYPSIRETYFEPVTMTFDFGPGGPQPLELLPCLRVYEGSTPQFSFVAAPVHSGEFEIDGASYQACVGYQYLIRGRLDEPSTTLILSPQGGEPILWWDGDELCSVHRLGGRFWRFACTPTGNQLFVRPYEGPVGALEIGAGGRNVEKLTVRGSLRSKEMAVAVGGGGLENGLPQPTRRCEIPAGDYYPVYMTVTLGDLSITVSNNYHTNAQGQSRSGREPLSGITVRQDKPYVLDFSHKPVVVFTEPYGAAEREFPVGSEITVKAVLVDPVLDIMIRGLSDASRTKTETFKTADGKEQTFSRPQSLDPKVTIARTNGEIVAEGVMPFG